ncbi:hypothetical protein SpCBS45565_g07097 [Spizellomyces sp. 'palustris']|nr:hypothetical protein SpCBS45565_g07097 [Spizellomyces sp. 'palustris']
MPPVTAPTLNYHELVDTLIEFLEVAIHYVLYVREIYPADIFEPRRKYNVPVRMSRHPVLNGYIRDVLAGIKPDLQKGVVSKVYLAIHDPARNVVEKFTFQIRSLMEGIEEGVRKHAQTSINTSDVEAYLRSFLLKIAVCDSMLNPNPPELAGDNPTPTSASTGAPWVPSEPTDVEVTSPSLIPLKTMDAGLLKMQLYVEESDAKQSSKG